MSIADSIKLINIALERINKLLSSKPENFDELSKDDPVKVSYQDLRQQHIVMLFLADIDVRPANLGNGSDDFDTEALLMLKSFYESVLERLKIQAKNELEQLSK